MLSQGNASVRHVAAVAATCVITFFAGTTAANAADRYASPTGTGDCSVNSPCNFTTATTGLNIGDRVILKPGTYAINSTLNIAGWELRGESTANKPLITSTADTLFTMGPTDSALTDVRIQQSSSSPYGRAVYASGNSTVSRVDVSSNTTACELRDFALLRDSLCRGGTDPMGGGIVIYAGSGANDVDVRNVTATGGNGIFAGTFNAGVNLNMDVRNSILRGSVNDIRATNNGSISSLSVGLTSSNYDSIDVALTSASVTPVNSGNNQAAAPSFLDEGGGDLRPTADSPTVNAGTADGLNGPADLNGVAHTSGGNIDIGAYEYVTPVAPPTDTTPPETTINRGPKKKSSKRKAKFTFSSSESGSSFVCKVDRKAAAPCTSPLKVKRLKPGKHRLNVVATDAAGNADATAATYRWKTTKG